ncbi:MAG: HIT domain-containing protein [Patescibacteria group bacterium]|nr:HIT domain-containing protein [Patescibacteria group bacterium]
MAKEQYKFADILQKSSRAGAGYWYGDVWKKVDKCVFCDLNDRYIIKKLGGIILTTNIYPYTNGHLLIIPKRHITHVKQLSKSEWENVRILLYISKKLLREVLGIKDVWVIYREGRLGPSSEKTVEHLHIHVIPYTKGLVQWNYQSINHGPFEVANSFKKADDFMNSLIKRFKINYSKKND